MNPQQKKVETKEKNPFPTEGKSGGVLARE